MIRNSYVTALVLIAGGLMNGQSVLAQRHELGLTLGAVGSGTRSSPLGSLDLSRGTALQANYGFRFLDRSKVALFAEAHFLANPIREVASPNTQAPADFATLYVVPGLRVKFRPASRFSPYVAVGGGYALYERSGEQIGGGQNLASRFTNRGAFAFGGGVDFPLWRFLGGRWEIRDFYTGNPDLNVPLSSGGQHNLVVGGGLVLRFGQGES